MINIQQDDQGFIRMSRRFPEKLLISITFSDGSQETYSGRRLNELYDNALAEFRAGNNMDAKGSSRLPAKTIHRRNAVDFVPVHPGMAK